MDCFSILPLIYQIALAATVTDLDGIHLENDEAPNVTTENKHSWKEHAKIQIRVAIQDTQRIAEQHRPAKNVILFIGDGMGVSTVTAARTYFAQLANLTAQEATLSWENFQNTALSKTYSTNFLTPDSAASATALLTGEKTRSRFIAVSHDAFHDNCSSIEGRELKSILHRAIDKGKWTGLVTTARVTHATPACAYAHTPNRDWEDDDDLPQSARGVCLDIADQLVNEIHNKDIRVILGGGRRHFLPSYMHDPEHPRRSGNREDRRDLIMEWLQDKADRGLHSLQYAYVFNQSDFDNINATETDYLMGLFEDRHMLYELDRVDKNVDDQGEPSISDMVRKAVEILQKGENGFFLLVESGRIDHAHHNNNAKRALHDTFAFSKAVQVAIDMTNDTDTLLVVTADHSHVFTIAGYSEASSDILQFDEASQLGSDGKPFTTLGYTNGPGYYEHRIQGASLRIEVPRKNISEIKEELASNDYMQDAGIPMSSETHGGEDVAVYARGPLSHLFKGTQEQSYFGNLMMYALCVDDNNGICAEEYEHLLMNRPMNNIATVTSQTVYLLRGTVLIMICLL